MDAQELLQEPVVGKCHTFGLEQQVVAEAESLLAVDKIHKVEPELLVVVTAQQAVVDKRHKLVLEQQVVAVAVPYPVADKHRNWAEQLFEAVLHTA